MSRVNQIVSNTNTIVKKIVVGTPIKRVAGDLNNIRTTSALHNQILVFDSDLGLFVPTNPTDASFSTLIKTIIDSSYVTATVDPNLLPNIDIDSGTIRRIVDSDFVAALTPGGIDSALVQKIIDSAYIDARALTDSFDVIDLFAYLDRVELGGRNGAVGDGGDIVFKNHLIPADSGISLGSLTNRFKDLYVEGQSVVIGNVKINESDGSLYLVEIDSNGISTGRTPNFSIAESNLQTITEFSYTAPENKILLRRTGQEDLSVVIDTFSSPTITGTLKGPSEFVIDPIPYNSPLGRVTINGRLYIAGDELISDATTLKFPNTKTFELGENLDSDVDANGGGLILGGAGATITYRSLTDRWVFNKDVEVQKFYGKYVGFESDLALYTSDNIPEGSTNLYFTNSRADARINTVVDATYINDLVDIPEAGTDSAAVINIVTGLIDSSYSRTLTELLDDLDSARAFISSYVDSSYVQARFLAISGELTSVEVEPAGSQYVFTTALNELVLEDSDDNGNVLSFSPTNVDVHKNGLMLIKGVDFSTNDGTEIFLGEPSDENDVYVVTSSRRQSYNFYNALTDSSQAIPGTSNTSVDIFAKADYRFVKYTITAEVFANSLNKYQASEMLITHNNTEAFYTEYGIVQAQDSSLGEVTVVVDGANVKVKFDPVYPNTTVKFSKNSL